jgi:hypothetical protein
VQQSELRTATEVAGVVATALRCARQRYLTPEIENMAILSGMNTPMFTLTFNDTRESYIVSVQRRVDA